MTNNMSLSDILECCGPDDRLWTQGDRKFVIRKAGADYHVFEGGRKIGLIWEYRREWRYSLDQGQSWVRAAENAEKALSGLIALAANNTLLVAIRDSLMSSSPHRGLWISTNKQ